MSPCPAFERLAAAASGEDEAILAHLDDCADCQQIVEEQGAMRLLAAQAPEPRLTAAHREALGAEIMAHADAMPLRRQRTLPLVGGVLAIAAAATLFLGLGALRSASPDVATIAPTIDEPAPAPTIEQAADDEVVVSPYPTTVIAEVRHAKLDGTGRYSRTQLADHEVVKLSSGELVVDTADPQHPVHVVTGDTRLALKHARVKVIATKGAISQVSVFSGTAEITVNGKTQIIEAGTVWELPATPADSSTAFQEGWAALREGRNTEAIAAFDRAVDPMVAEDALYWGAIASERDGDTDGANERYKKLLEQFPKSPRAKKVKKALQRIFVDSSSSASSDIDKPTPP